MKNKKFNVSSKNNLKNMLLKLIKTRFNSVYQYRVLLLGLTVLCIASCKKEGKNDNELEEVYPEYGYEVDCDFCDISYTDDSNNYVTKKDNLGVWNYKFEKKVTFELKLSIKTTHSSYSSIQAYILKDSEVVHGNLGYNYADMLYNTRSGIGTLSFGQYNSGGASGGGSSGGGSSGGSTKPVSSVCGAKNKTGGYCKRVVSGGGRCWQHK